MKQNLTTVFAIVFIAGIFVSSCDDKLFEEQPANEKDNYLVSYEKVSDISQIETEAIFTYLGGSYPEAETIKNEVKTSIRVFKITYNTVFQEDSIVASGLVCVPFGSDEFPLLSFQNGTNTLHEDAPSVNPDLNLYKFLEAVSSTGFVLAIPDYIGFGSTEEKFHPYLDKESTVKSITDMLMAVKELAQSHNLDFNLSNDLYITGYSMGGWATLALQKKLEEDYADVFNLKASACSAGPYDLTFINSHIMSLDTYPMPYFLGFMLDSYNNMGYITNDLTDIVREPYASRIPMLFDGMKDGEQINSQLTTKVDSLFTESYKEGYLTSPDFSSVRLALLNNSIQAWDISTPLALLHGEADEFVTPLVSEKMYDDFVNDAGVDENMIQILLFPGIDHPEGIIPCGISTINWFLDLKNGE